MPGKHPHTKTTAQFVEQARAKHGDKYDYSQVRYVNAKRHVLIRCPKHGWSRQMPEVHLKGSGCPRCRYVQMAKTRARSWEEILHQFRNVHGDRYDYSLVEYVNVTRKITIICPEHGAFEQQPFCHAAGRGCPKCRYELLSAMQRLSLQEILERFREVHDERYDYSRVVQPKNCTHKVVIVCRTHGPFRQTIAGHAAGRGCPACRESRGERRVARTLDRLGVAYVREKRFASCRDVRPLPFDFYVPSKRTLIEYDGQQHFLESDRFNLAAIQKHDAIKTEWAQRNGMRLLRIPYHRLQAIPQILSVEFTKS